MKYVLLLVCLIGISVARKLPSFIEVCKPKHTDVSECIKRNIEVIRPKLKDGIPEMQIPSMYPYLVPSAGAQLGQNFEAKLKNMKIYLSNDFLIQDLKSNLDNLTLYVKIKIPEAQTIADYSVTGKLLVLNLNGGGLGFINITDIQAEVMSYGVKENRNGKDYIVIQKLDIMHKLSNISIHLDNLFPNNKELTDSANKLFNQNVDVLIEDFSPIVIKVVKEFIINLMNNFFSRYSYDVLFPDD